MTFYQIIMVILPKDFGFIISSVAEIIYFYNHVFSGYADRNVFEQN